MMADRDPAYMNLSLKPDEYLMVNSLIRLQSNFYVNHAGNDAAKIKETI